MLKKRWETRSAFRYISDIFQSLFKLCIGSDKYQLCCFNIIKICFSPHPYVFFNYDGQTMTFLGFNVDRQTGDIQDPRNQMVLEQGVMPRALQDGLIRNRVALNENFDALNR